MDSPASLHPDGIDQNGEGSGGHALSGMVTGTEDISVEDRLKRDMIHSRNVQRTANWKKIKTSTHQLLRDQWAERVRVCLLQCSKGLLSW